MPSLRSHDLRCLRDCGLLGGVDEAGRGALAGPVVAGAVFVDRKLLNSVWAKREMAKLNDSKQLTPLARDRLFELLQKAESRGRLRSGAGVASVEEIDSENILGATRLAMLRALAAACPEGVELPLAGGEGPLLFSADRSEMPVVHLILDGLPMHPFPYAHRGLVKGDGKSFAIALASIVAKVTRDRLMEALDADYPQYGFGEHKGYATRRHCEAIRAHGACPLHRPLFLRKILAGETLCEQGQEELFEECG